jgi:hypothetical protein
MNVISCSRTSTKDGFSAIETVVEISKDARTKDVSDSVRLTFQFQREKVHTDSNEHERNPSPSTSTSLERKQNCPTHITYDIYYSKDHGEKKRLVSVEVFAQNDFPSIEDAAPMDESEMQGEGIEKNPEEMPVTPSSDEKSNGDKYAADADPENIEEFLAASGLDFLAENALFFLMTFPFYEHEWDVFGFLLDCVFGGNDDSDEYEDMSDSEDGD